MTTTIELHLREHMVAFLDAAVASGAATSREDVIAGALERDLRRTLAERDVQILHDWRVTSDNGGVDDLDPLVDWAAEHVTWDLDS